MTAIFLVKVVSRDREQKGFVVARSGAVPAGSYENPSTPPVPAVRRGGMASAVQRAAPPVDVQGRAAPLLVRGEPVVEVVTRDRAGRLVRWSFYRKIDFDEYAKFVR